MRFLKRNNKARLGATPISAPFSPKVMAALSQKPAPKEIPDILPLLWPLVDGKERKCHYCGGKTFNVGRHCLRCIQQAWKEGRHKRYITDEAYYRLFVEELERWYAAHPLVPNGTYTIEIGAPEPTEYDKYSAKRSFRITEGEFIGIKGVLIEEHKQRDAWYGPVDSAIKARLRPYGLAEDD